MIAVRHLPLADPDRDVPRHPGARADRIHDALVSLRAELRRLERLGLERPLARCRESLRFWMFLQGLHAAAAAAPTPFPFRGDRPWPRAAVR